MNGRLIVTLMALGLYGIGTNSQEVSSEVPNIVQKPDSSNSSSNATVTVLNNAENSTNSSRKSRAYKPIAYKDVLSCVAALDFECAIDKSEDILENTRINLLAQADLEARSTGRAKDSDSTPTALVDTISQIFSELTEVVNDGFSGLFRSGKESDDDGEGGDENDVANDDDDDLEDDEEDENNTKTDVEEKQDVGIAEQRGKKKKKKLIALIKLLILGAVLKAKLGLLLKALAVKIQIKFLLIALAGLLLNAARFWIDLKKGHQPQKVIYYEHAQHQHHYEGGEDDWSSHPPSGSGSWWGRAYDEGEEQKTPHDMAYAKQKPLYVSRVSEKPNDSGFFWG